MSAWWSSVTKSAVISTFAAGPEAFNSSELYQKYFKIPCEKLTAMRITRTKNPDDTYSYTYERRVDDLKNASTQARDVLLPIPENEANNLYSLTNVRWQNSGW